MKVAVPNKAFSNSAILVSELRGHFNNIILNHEGKRYNGRDLVDFIQDAEYLIVGLEEINKQFIDACRHIKMIVKFGVGLNNIDLEYCKKKGIEIGWRGGVNKRSVAEMTLGYMLMLLRNLYVTSNQLKNGHWNKNGGVNLSGKTVGIIGVGHIGKELIELLKPFSCRILVNDIVDQSEYYESADVEYVEKSYLFSNSDVISIHTDLNDNTVGLINQSVFEQMKNDAIFLNSARGEIVNLEDLKVALKNGDIAGAAVDVYDAEPPKDKELLGIENLINTPHIGGNSIEAVLAMGRSAIDYLVSAKQREDGGI